ncbi:MAG TPA: alanine racemase [Candidatus Limnocylindrales bacterium]
MTKLPGAIGGRITATRLPLIEVRPGEPLPPLPKMAWLDIDLDALVENVRLLTSLLPAGVRLEPVVKADAYGHGAVPVARALVRDGARSLSVATFDEALELRQAGIDVPILIVFPIPPELAPSARRHGMSVTAGDQVLLARTLAALADDVPPGQPAAATSDIAERQLVASGSGDSRLAIHLEVETGLGRGGVDPDLAPAAAAAIKASPHARLAGLWSHLQSAGNTDLTAGQDRRFGIAADLLEATGVTLPARHLAASGAVLAASVPPYDAARVGLAIYGLVPDGLEVAEGARAVAAALRPVMSLRARPIRVAWLEPGTGVSYGPSFTTARRSLIATLPLGYADGYPRSLSNRARVLVRGTRVPLVGTVAMDAVMVDVTDVPGHAVSVDDEFTLLGEQGGARIGALEVARWGNTISHEIVSAMSGRLPRVYYAAAEAVGLRTIACDSSRGGRGFDWPPAEASVEDPGPFGRE